MISLYQVHPRSSVAQETILVLVLRKAIYGNSIARSLSISAGEAHAVSARDTDGVPAGVVHAAPALVVSAEVLRAVRTGEAAVRAAHTVPPFPRSYRGHFPSTSDSSHPPFPVGDG